MVRGNGVVVLVTSKGDFVAIFVGQEAEKDCVLVRPHEPQAAQKSALGGVKSFLSRIVSKSAFMCCTH